MASDADVDVRQELLRRIRTHQASINAYVRKMQGRRELVANISIVSSVIAAALVAGPAVGGATFAETVRKGFGWESSSSVWVLLCLTALIVNIVAAIFTNLSKSNDPTERINTAEACNAALEGLRTDVEFGRQPTKIAAAEYRQIAARVLFVAADSADDADAYSNDEASALQPSRALGRYRRSAEVIIPGTAIVFGCVILLTTVIGLGRGFAATGAPVSTVPQSAGSQISTAARVVLSNNQVTIGNTYSVTASGFSPGEGVQISWTGQTSGVMGVFPADLGGNATHGGIVERDPPGRYSITAIGQTSRRIASTELVVRSRN